MNEPLQSMPRSFPPQVRKTSMMTDSHLICHRPLCDDPAVAYIPMPGKEMHLCSLHEAEARDACYFVLPIGGPYDESDFNHRIAAKHLALRGTNMLFYPPRHVLAKRGLIN